MDFDFLTDIEEPKSNQSRTCGPNTKTMRKFTRRDLNQAILDVVHDMGPKAFFLEMKAVDPKSFYGHTQKMIDPKADAVDDLIQLKLIDRFGRVLEDDQDSGEPTLVDITPHDEMRSLPAPTHRADCDLNPTNRRPDASSKGEASPIKIVDTFGSATGSSPDELEFMRC